MNAILSSDSMQMNSHFIYLNIVCFSFKTENRPTDQPSVEIVATFLYAFENVVYLESIGARRLRHAIKTEMRRMR